LLHADRPDSLDILALGGVSDQEPMLTELPQVPGLGAWRPSRILEGRVKIEVLGALLLLASLQTPQQISDLVFREPREGQVDLRAGLKVGQEAGEELLVPGPGDLVEPEVQRRACSIDRSR